MTRWKAIPILGARDAAATVAYLRESLGFRLVDEHRPGGELVYAILCRGDATVHVQIRRRDVYPPDREGHETEIYVEVDDVDALYAEYTSAGVRVLRDLRDEPYGMRDFTVELPDGARLSFASRLD